MTTTPRTTEECLNSVIIWSQPFVKGNLFTSQILRLAPVIIENIIITMKLFKFSIKYYQYTITCIRSCACYYNVLFFQVVGYLPIREIGINQSCNNNVCSLSIVYFQTERHYVSYLGLIGCLHHIFKNDFNLQRLNHFVLI